MGTDISTLNTGNFIIQLPPETVYLWTKLLSQQICESQPKYQPSIQYMPQILNVCSQSSQLDL